MQSVSEMQKMIDMIVESFSKASLGSDILIEYLLKNKIKHDYSSTHDLEHLETRI